MDEVLTFDYDGKTFTNFERADAEAAGVPSEVLDAAELDSRRAAMSCTPRQARRALDEADLLDSVEAYIATAPKAVQIDWEYASSFRRDYGAITTAGTALGMTDSQIDDLFIAAMTL